MTRAELIQELRQRGVDKVYGRALSRCLKDELDSYLRSLSREDGKYYSWTQINMMLRCGLQYYYRYLRGIKIPPSAFLTLGRSYDSAVNHNYQQKIISGEDVPIDELTDVFHEKFFTLRDETDWGEEDPNKVEQKGISLIKIYRKDLAPLVQPADVQKDIIYGFEELPYSFRTILDLITVDNEVVDNKTASRSYNQDDVDNDMQLTAQSLAFRTEYGMEEAGLGFDVAVSTKQPKIQRLRTKRGPEDHMRFLRIVAQVVEAIRKRVFLPPPPGSWFCHPKWCGYWVTCRKEI